MYKRQVLACIIFSLFAASPPAVEPNAAAVSMVWSYIGALVFNMLVLVGAVKMADRVVREMTVSYTHLDVYKRQYYNRQKRHWREADAAFT